MEETVNHPIRIIIIEDNQAFAGSLQKMIEIHESLACIAAFRSAEDCLDAFQRADKPSADVILLDLQLPGKDGLTLVPYLKQFLPDADILVLTQKDNYLTTLEAIRLGVSGYILKHSSIVDIRNAIFDVREGGTVIDSRLSRLVLNALKTEGKPDSNPLSDREREVLELLAMGYVKKEIADRLSLSYRTITQSTERIYKKLQVPNIAAAVATAIRKGLIQ